MTAAVIDSSVFVDLLVDHPRSPRASAAIEGVEGVVPALFDAEVLSAITRRVRHGELSTERANQALELLTIADLERIPIEPLVMDAWALRHSVSSGDAFYVVLARVIGCPLITCDRALAGAPKLGITVTVVQ